MSIRSASLLALALANQAAHAQQPREAIIPGYVHTVEKSRFHAGGTLGRVQATKENGFVKYRGPNGVLAIDEQTGLTIGVAGGGRDKGAAAPAQNEAAQLLDPDKHNQQVLDYLVGAGLPRDQIGAVHANTYLTASGRSSEAIHVQPRVDGYATIISRKVGGFTVVDSVAWARIGENGRVLAETIYWPQIPVKVLNDARRLNARVNGRYKEKYRSGLASVQKSGQVVIRHSSPFAGAPFQAFASYDVNEISGSPEQRSKSSHVRHFDINGREFRLPQEMRDAGRR